MTIECRGGEPIKFPTPEELKRRDALKAMKIISGMRDGKIDPSSEIAKRATRALIHFATQDQKPT